MGELLQPPQHPCGPSSIPPPTALCLSYAGDPRAALPPVWGSLTFLAAWGTDILHQKGGPGAEHLCNLWHLPISWWSVSFLSFHIWCSTKSHSIEEKKGGLSTYPGYRLIFEDSFLPRQASCSLNMHSEICSFPPQKTTFGWWALMINSPEAACWACWRSPVLHCSMRRTSSSPSCCTMQTSCNGEHGEIWEMQLL